MKKLYIKFMFLASTIITAGFFENNMSEILAVCLTFLLSLLCELFDDKKKTMVSGVLESIISCLYSLISNKFSLAFIFGVYDLFPYKKLLFADIIFNSIFYIKNFGIQYGSLYILVCMVVTFLAYFESKSDELEQKLFEQRDLNEQEKLMLNRKNKNLIAAQNTAILNATLHERNRIAREIHDNVGHMLTRSILQLAAISTVNQANGNIAPLLEGLDNTLKEAMTNIRNSVHDLHDESIDLNSALQSLIKNIDSLKINLKTDVSANIDKNLKYDFISIIKEAINNTIKHSNADRINIELIEHTGFFKLCIHDNGTIPVKDTSGGIGLESMKERVKNRSGNIDFYYDKGFKIYIVIMKS